MTKAKNIEVALEVLKYTAILAVGFFAVKVALDVKNGAASTADALAKNAKAVVDAINPTNPDNIAAKAVNAVGAAIVTAPDGPGKNADGSFSVGAWFRDVTHPAEAAAVAAMSGPVAPAAQAVTQTPPTDPLEAFRKSEIAQRNAGFNLEQTLTGNDGAFAVDQNAAIFGP